MKNIWILRYVSKLKGAKVAYIWGFPGGASGKNLPANARDVRDTGLTPRLERSPRGACGNLLQYSCLENSMDRGAWQSSVHGVARSQIWQKRLSAHAHLYIYTFLLGGRRGCFPCFLAYHMAQRLKHLPPIWETWVRSLGREDPLEKEMVTHSSILAWRSPWTEKPGRLQSMGL